MPYMQYTVFLAASIAVAQFGAILYVVGMLPTLAIMLTGQARIYLVRAVFMLNLTGVIPYLVDMHHAGGAFKTAIALLKDHTSWMMMWGAAAGGYLLVFALPWIVYQLFRAVSDLRISRIEEAQKELIEEWGEAVYQATA